MTTSDWESVTSDDTANCNICHREISGSDIHIDHDHVSGKVRGLLCLGCNTGLGHFKESVDILKSAIGYLERPPLTARGYVVGGGREPNSWTNTRNTRTGTGAVNRVTKDTCGCGYEKSIEAAKCRACHYRTRSGVDWPSDERLAGMVELIGLSGTGRELGVSGNAVKKRLDKLRG